LIAEHAPLVLGLVPRGIALRAIVFVGLLLPWAWLVAADKILNEKR
jgi:hypothetical protein